MHVALVAFDKFTDIDLFLPWDLLNRVSDPRYSAQPLTSWRVSICADAARINSVAGLAIDTHGPLALANDANAVFIVSGPGSRAKIRDDAFLGALRLDPARQLIAAIDSGALILAKLGLLEGLSATTYPSVFPELEALGVRTEHRTMVVHGNIATGGACLAAQDLSEWIIRRLIGPEMAALVANSIARLGD